MNKFLLMTFAIAAFLNHDVQSQPYPSKPIRFIVPFSAGGGNDVLARLIGQGLTSRLGVSIVVDNRDGASTIIGTEIAAKSPPDGYTIYMGNNSSLAINPALSLATNPGIFKKLPYDAVKDFAPIVAVAKAPFVLVVNPAVPVKNAKELIELARSQPGKLNYASGGVGISTHLAGELLKNMAKIDIVLVTYRGASQMMAAVVGGEVQMTFTNIVSSLPQIKSGRLRAIAVTGLQRSVALPDVQTVEESSGLKGYEAGVWYGVLAPAKTPADIVLKLNATITQVLNDNKVRDRIVSDGANTIAGTPAEFASLIRTDIDKWSRVIKQAGLKLE